MGLKAILRTVVQECPGSLGALLMGYDGIVVEEYLLPAPGVDLQLLAVEYASALKEVSNTVAVLQTGQLEEVTIVSERSAAVLRGFSDDLFLVLVLGGDGNLGKGRYLLKREAPGIREALQ